VAAHPGHELRVHGWLESARPFVCFLTDGSGRSTKDRLESSRRVLAAAGAQAGPVFGRLRDAKAYEAILAGDVALFFDLAQELADHFVGEQISFVAADAAEGYNPVHDICRSVVNAAVVLSRRPISCWSYPLVGSPDQGDAGSYRFELNDEAFSRKLASARAYPELVGEVDAAMSDHGADAFRVECLMPVDPQARVVPPENPPFYERYGEQRVNAGHYARVLRYREHVAPLEEAIRQRAARAQENVCAS
jgi:hypothetical protein